MSKKFYVTTPIYYPTGDLHIGHVYTTILADTLKKYKQQKEFETYFVTGSDEHGQKITEKALTENLEPKTFLDKQVVKFKDLWKLLEIDYDQFIRTTDPKHEMAVQKIFSDLINKGQIYKGEYWGKYCVPCESSWQLSQLEKVDGEFVCPDCKRELREVKEESYFMKLSGKEEFLKDLFKKDFLFPKRNVSELLSKFIEPGLLDLSVSRSTFKWGVPVKEDPNHVIYVWIDALPNYITALGYNSDNTDLFDKFWTNDTEILHIVGKEIIRFHSIYWPVLLNNLGIIKDNIKVMGHGWITSEGQKMSKSIGNVIDPVAIIHKYGLEHLRYYLLKEIKTSTDGDFSQERFINSYNADLANKYGNLISRTMSMIKKYFDGIIPKYNGIITDFDQDLERKAKATIENYTKEMDSYMISEAIKHIILLIDKANLYIDNTKPWELAKDDSRKDDLESVMNHLIKVIEISSFLFKPILIKTADRALKQININNTTFENLLDYNKNSRIKINEKINLFPRLEIK